MDKKEKRVRLAQGKHRELIINASNKLGSLRNLAKDLRISYSTLKNYSSEVVLFPESLFEKILELVRVKKESVEANYLNSNWGASLGGKRGMEVLTKKYPDKILEWKLDGIRKAIEMGKHYGYSNQKSIKNQSLIRN